MTRSLASRPALLLSLIICEETSLKKWPRFANAHIPRGVKVTTFKSVMQMRDIDGEPAHNNVESVYHINVSGVI